MPPSDCVWVAFPQDSCLPHLRPKTWLPSSLGPPRLPCCALSPILPPAPPHPREPQPTAQLPLSPAAPQPSHSSAQPLSRGPWGVGAQHLSIGNGLRATGNDQLPCGRPGQGAVGLGGGGWTGSPLPPPLGKCHGSSSIAFLPGGLGDAPTPPPSQPPFTTALQMSTAANEAGAGGSTLQAGSTRGARDHWAGCPGVAGPGQVAVSLPGGETSWLGSSCLWPGPLAPGTATPQMPEGMANFKHPKPWRPTPPRDPGAASLLRVVPDEKPQGGEVSFGGGVVDREGTRVCGCGGVPTAVTQQPVHHLGVAEAGSQVQDCGTRIVFVLWEEGALVPQPVLPRLWLRPFPHPSGHGAALSSGP